MNRQVGDGGELAYAVYAHYLTPLIQFSESLVTKAMTPLELTCLTTDVDGTVVRSAAADA